LLFSIIFSNALYGSAEEIEASVTSRRIARAAVVIVL
jgi:hypothetical protein